MKYRFKLMCGALALTFMVLFGTVAFAHSTNTSMANPVMSSARVSLDKQRQEERKEWRRRRHHRHRRHWRR
jgi:hypothetical protein